MGSRSVIPPSDTPAMMSAFESKLMTSHYTVVKRSLGGYSLSVDVWFRGGLADPSATRRKR